MAKKYITISRQFGTGGHTIGQEVANRLGIPFYDHALVHEIAQKAHYDEAFVEAMDNMESAGRSIFSLGFLGKDTHGKSFQDYIWDAEKAVIQDLTAEGPFVIVGRAADYLLKDNEDALRVMIGADMEYRKNHILETYGENEVPIEKRIAEKDKRREANYYFRTNQHFGQRENYDICLRSDRLGNEGCIRAIMHAYLED